MLRKWSLVRAHVHLSSARHWRARVWLCRGIGGERLIARVDEVAGGRGRRGMSGAGWRLGAGPAMGRCSAGGSVFAALLRKLVALSVLVPRELVMLCQWPSSILEERVERVFRGIESLPRVVESPSSCGLRPEAAFTAALQGKGPALWRCAGGSTGAGRCVCACVRACQSCDLKFKMIWLALALPCPALACLRLL